MDRSWGYGSDRRNRHDNQDRLGVFELPQCTLAIVCDGMGGHVGGAAAATLTVRVIYDFMKNHPDYALADGLREALEKANLEVYEAARKDHRLMGMGTTAVVAAMADDQVVIAHVGDSRAYLVRSGQAKVATRDHTMVNLFVDAELLTPEDAATHPEAHVLSRSIGTERQVDVEVSEPIRLDEGDAVLLCSDGVHGVVADFELSDVDWSNPHTAIQELLEVVVLREGDDNASAVALRYGAPIGDIPPETPLPSADQVENEIQGGTGRAGSTISEADVDRLDDSADTTGEPRAEAGELPQYVVYEEQEAPPKPVEDLRERAKTVPRVEAPSTVRSRRPLLAVLAVLGVAGVLGGAYVWRARQRSADLDAAIRLARDAGAEPAPSAAPASAAPEPVAVAFFQVEIPEPPKRPKHVPVDYVDPPPRSREQILAVQEARNRACASAMDAVDQGMAYSPDHAALYQDVWTCFDVSHVRPVAAAQLNAPSELASLLVHLEGDPAVRPVPPEAARWPAWAQPPVDGVEYRLEAYIHPERGERMASILKDRLGPGRVADGLGSDLLLEARIAAALAAAPSLTPEQQGWWARRMFVLGRIMASPAWPIVKAQRPDLATLIEAALAEATGPLDANGKPKGLPGEVSTAYEMGKTGGRPEVKRAAVEAPRAPREPTDEDLAGP